jgi:hypothetical protein
MNLQRRLLRAMLWMLGLSAGAGVLAVFLSTRVMGRVAGTALVAAIAVGLAMPVSRLMDDERKRLGGIVGLGSMVVALLLALGAIWVDLFWMFGDVEWRLASNALVTAIAGLLCANLIAGRLEGTHWWARTVGLYTCIAGPAPLAAAVWLNYPLASWLAQSGWLLLASGTVAAFSLVGVGVEGRLWRWAGVAGAALALVIGLVGVWTERSNDPTAYIASIGIGGAVAYAIVVLRVPLGEARAWACLVAIGSVAATALLSSLLSLSSTGFNSTAPELLSRLTGAMAIVAACSTLGIVILYRLNRRTPESVSAPSEVREVQLVCPHCARRHAAPVGDSSCPGCGLMFTVKVSEPRCIKCEYPLLDLRGAVCPECGTPR